MNPLCPACRQPTELVRWQDIAGFECPECGGHSVRPDELQPFLTRHRKTQAFSQLMETARDAPVSSRKLVCPDCRTQTYHAVRSGLVEIDVCDTCIGIYFDRHEATTYLVQTRARTTAGKVASGAVTSIEALGALIEFIMTIFH